MHNLTSWASKKLLQAVVFERQEGYHFTDSIKSWHLVIYDLPSLVCLNKVSNGHVHSHTCAVGASHSAAKPSFL